MGSQQPAYMLKNKDRFTEVHSYNSLFFFLTTHSKASCKSAETVNQTQLFTSKQLSHPLLKLKHNSAVIGIPSSMWTKRTAAGKATWLHEAVTLASLKHLPSKAKGCNLPPSYDCPPHVFCTS